MGQLGHLAHKGLRQLLCYSCTCYMHCHEIGALLQNSENICISEKE